MRARSLGSSTCYRKSHNRVETRPVSSRAKCIETQFIFRLLLTRYISRCDPLVGLRWCRLQLIWLNFATTKPTLRFWIFDFCWTVETAASLPFPEIWRVRNDEPRTIPNLESSLDTRTVILSPPPMLWRNTQRFHLSIFDIIIMKMITNLSHGAIISLVDRALKQIGTNNFSSA